MRKRSDQLRLCLLLGVLAVGLGAWSWHQNTRPGKLHYERGLDYAAAKHIPQAEQEWRAGTREDPQFPDNHAQLGDLYAAQGRFPEAAAQYETATRFTSQDSTLFQRLAKAEDSAGKADAALSASCQAASLRPNDAEAQADCGIRAAKLNQPARAIPFLTLAHALTPNNADDLIYLVRAEFQTNDLTGVERDLTPFVQSHPDNAEACYLMAYLLHQKPLTPAALQTALDYAKRAYDAAPGNEQAGTLLGQLELADGKPSKALTVFQQAQKIAPHSLTIQKGLLSCYTQLHQPRQAAIATANLKAETVRRARSAILLDRLTANPSDTAAALEMARLREENGETDLARTYYEQAVRYAPQDTRAQAALKAFRQRHTT